MPPFNHADDAVSSLASALGKLEVRRQPLRDNQRLLPTTLNPNRRAPRRKAAEELREKL